MLPTFIGIGPGRTGTSMLYEVLLQHPQVCMASGTKETNYFVSQYEHTEEWYKQFFESCESFVAIGELSNNYFYSAAAPGRIKALLPEIKLFCCLRNPFERLVSVYSYRKRSGEISHALSLEEAIKRFPDLVTHNYYASLLANYDVHFASEQLLVLLYDDLQNDPRAFVQEILKFIGVDQTFESAQVYRKVNARSSLRTPILASVVGLTSRTLREVGLHWLLTWMKRTRIVRSMVLKSSQKDSETVLSAQTVGRLRELWAPEVAQIEQRVGRDLSHWLEWQGEGNDAKQGL